MTDTLLINYHHLKLAASWSDPFCSWTDVNKVLFMMLDLESRIYKIEMSEELGGEINE